MHSGTRASRCASAHRIGRKADGAGQIDDNSHGARCAPPSDTNGSSVSWIGQSKALNCSVAPTQNRVLHERERKRVLGSAGGDYAADSASALDRQRTTPFCYSSSCTLRAFCSAPYSVRNRKYTRSGSGMCLQPSTSNPLCAGFCALSSRSLQTQNPPGPRSGGKPPSLDSLASPESVRGPSGTKVDRKGIFIACLRL